jgi:Na+/H+ antiporter NhaD/arsenite permease-like protein
MKHMKLDYKKKEIQKKYREKIQERKINKNHKKEVFIVCTILVLIFLLNFYFKSL